MTTSAPTDAFARAHAALLRERGWQFDFPAFAPTPSPSWLAAWKAWLRGLGPTAGWVFWGVVALVLLAVVALAARELVRSRGGRGAALSLRAGLGPAPAAARALLAEADALAEAGRFGEAVHLLLLRTLEDLDRRRPQLLAPALTSREIAAHPALLPPVRAPLGRIAAATEAHLFAGLATPAPAFASARADYEAFLQAAERA